MRRGTDREEMDTVRTWLLQLEQKGSWRKDRACVNRVKVRIKKK